MQKGETAMKKLRKRLALVSCVLLLLSMTCNSVLAAEIPSGEGTPNAEITLDETGDPEPEEKETEEAAPEGTESEQDETKEEEPEELETNGTETDVVEPGDSKSDDAEPEETESVEKETEVTDPTESDSEGTEPETKLPEEGQPAEPEDEEKDPAETEAVGTPETLPEENQTEETLPEESEAAEETKEKVNLLSVSQKMTMPISSEGTVTLEGFEGDGVTVTLNEDGTLKEIPKAPDREGWDFDAWYTAEVNEIYLDGGDPIPGRKYGPEDLSGTNDAIEHMKDALANTKTLADLEEKYSGETLDSHIKEMHHSWVIDTWGEKVTLSTDLSDVDTIYARYTPKKAEIIWDSDGWNASSGALHSGRSYGSYVYPWTLNPSKWGDRTFEGWSFERGGDVDLEPDTVYQVGEGPLEWDKFGESGSVRLYAVWDGGTPRAVSEITVTKSTSSSYRLTHFDFGWRVKLYYTIKPSDAIYGSVEWGSDQPSHVKIEPQSGNSAIVTVYRGVPSETVTVTVSAGGKTGEITIPVKHNMVLKYKQDPTCQHTGFARYECSYCPEDQQLTLPQTEHKFKSSSFAATCTEDGCQGP